MKKHTKKHSNIPSYIGHNNPPKDIEPIEFTNSAILGIKVDELNFGNKIYLEIPFIVPKGSHLKGLLLTISKLYGLYGQNNIYTNSINQLRQNGHTSIKWV